MSKNARIGLVLCALYIVFYGGFVLLAAFWPEAMDRTPWLGINLAVWYGFGLIAGAIAMSLLYGLACRGSGDYDDGRAGNAGAGR